MDQLWNYSVYNIKHRHNIISIIHLVPQFSQGLSIYDVMLFTFIMEMCAGKFFPTRL